MISTEERENVFNKLANFLVNYFVIRTVSHRSSHVYLKVAFVSNDFHLTSRDGRFISVLGRNLK